MVANTTYAVTIWVSSILGSDSYIKLLAKIIDFDVQLQTSCVIIDYNKAKKKGALHLLGRYVFMTVLCVYYHFSRARPQFAEKITEIAFIFLIVLNSAVCYQATELVATLKTRFVLLNKQITTLVESSTTTVPKVDPQQIQKDFAILCKVCTLHHHLSKCVRRFNQAFGVILLAMFAASFNCIVLCLFYTSVALQMTVLNWDEVFYTAAASVPFIVDSIFVCHVCYTTIEEADKAGELIHRIETEDHDTIDEIEMFSLQMANEEVEFSAAGFFPVNYTLVFSIIGGVTTYIIILIQLSATIGKDH
ncbi:putative gustatory receptor 28b [Zophobas morio]